MPLVAHNNLPTFSRLSEEGHIVLSKNRALQQDIRELHIGLLNMMPDAALSATEKQFIGLIGNCNQIAQFYVYPFSLPELPRSKEALAHIHEHYFNFDDLQKQGLDALIISGANVANPTLELEPFWAPLTEVVHWASKNVASTLCSCLATHALVKQIYNIDRRRLSQKKWGVYSHHICVPSHPILQNINTRFDVPHSRYNDISREQFESAGLHVLAESADAGVHVASSPDYFSVIYFQGHPEYDVISLLKEYKRDVISFVNGTLEEQPSFPENYFSKKGEEIANTFLTEAIHAKKRGDKIPEFPEKELLFDVDNTWGDTGKAIVNNWLGLVYGLTSLDRLGQYMEGVDPNNPLDIKIL